ncbi:MAG: 30S ribosome-binding factor RbfA [Candidatus Latescibacteria bacterium]|nr:30S ribosome-binding factor RbfA [Candidatus Latescibacterota bacterium]
MSEKRIERINSLIRDELSGIIRQELKDPRLGWITVTRTQISGDLRHVKVYVSVLGDEENRVVSMEVLEGATGFLRRHLGDRIQLRHTPELLFRYDHSIEEGIRIDQLLDRVAGENNVNCPPLTNDE